MTKEEKQKFDYLIGETVHWKFIWPIEPFHTINERIGVIKRIDVIEERWGTGTPYFIGVMDSDGKEFSVGLEENVEITIIK